MRSITLAKTASAVVATGVVGGLASRGSQTGWYRSLRKPSFQPPPAAFPIAWNLLYADIAATSAHTIDKFKEQDRDDKARAFSVALAVNLALNASWSWIFFNRGRLGAAAIAAGALAVSSADLTRRAVDAQGPRGAILAPYPLWCAFATMLSTRIWMLNRSR
jgi:tryptophan-rich sensory protein